MNKDEILIIKAYLQRLELSSSMYTELFFFCLEHDVPPNKVIEALLLKFLWNNGDLLDVLLKPISKN